MLELVVLLAKVTRGLLLLQFVCLGYAYDVLATSLVTSGGFVKVFLSGPVLLRVIYGLIKLIFYRDDYGSGLLLGSILTLPFLVVPTMIFIFNLG